MGPKNTSDTGSLKRSDFDHSMSGGKMRETSVLYKMRHRNTLQIFKQSQNRCTSAKKRRNTLSQGWSISSTSTPTSIILAVPSSLPIYAR